MNDCPICNGGMCSIGEALVLGRYPAVYLQCSECGFSKAENPIWLQEAYSSAITSTDIGYAMRCESTVLRSKALLCSLFPRDAKFLDYGGGYGLFSRMMRDRGLDFVSYDPYCQPIFAAGCVLETLNSKMRYSAATSFEVFEHLKDPIEEISKIFEVTDTLFFTTLLISRPAPRLNDWWYYSCHHGQHISFYTEDSLRALAKRFGLKFYTNGREYHLLTSRTISRNLFKLLMTTKGARIFNFMYRRRSLLGNDAERLVAQSKASLAAKK